MTFLMVTGYRSKTSANDERFKTQTKLHAFRQDEAGLDAHRRTIGFRP